MSAKPSGQPSRQRWNRSAKSGFWDDIEREREIKKHVVIVGIFVLEPRRRLTDELIADVESLLVKRIKPWGNIQNRETRISRPGMQVICKGTWFGDHKEYRDI